jgi:hypothetical protein
MNFQNGRSKAFKTIALNSPIPQTMKRQDLLKWIHDGTFHVTSHDSDLSDVGVGGQVQGPMNGRVVTVKLMNGCEI